MQTITITFEAQVRIFAYEYSRLISGWLNITGMCTHRRPLAHFPPPPLPPLQTNTTQQRVVVVAAGGGRGRGGWWRWRLMAGGWWLMVAGVFSSSPHGPL
jgi:hypothetical protein